jgi:outer membrane lipopolysaccharide assembly protein LptE/RlpB
MMQRVLLIVVLLAAALLMGACDKEIREARQIDLSKSEGVQLYNLDAAGLESVVPTAEVKPHGPWEHL